MEGYGYPISVYYGDILLYIPALLRLMGFSVTQCFKFYILMINIGTVVCSYVFLIKNKHNTNNVKHTISVLRI